MKNNWFYLLLCLVIQHATQASTIALLPLATEQRYVEVQAKDYKIIPIANFGVSLTFNTFQVLFEHSNWESTSGNESLSFTEISQEYHLSYLHQLIEGTRWWRFYMGAGIGQYNSTVKTQYLNSEITDSPGNSLLVTGIASLQANYHYLLGQLDFKLIQAKDYSPQPQPAILLRLGICF